MKIMIYILFFGIFLVFFILIFGILMRSIGFIASSFRYMADKISMSVKKNNAVFGENGYGFKFTTKDVVEKIAEMESVEIKEGVEDDIEELS